MTSKTLAWTVGFEAHQAEKKRVPALDARVSALIHEAKGDRKTILKILSDWLAGWDSSNLNREIY